MIFEEYFTVITSPTPSIYYKCDWYSKISIQNLNFYELKAII